MEARRGADLSVVRIHNGTEAGRSALGMGARAVTVASADHQLGQAGLMRRRPARVPAPRSGFAGFRFSPDVIMMAVRWYVRYGLSYRDVEGAAGGTGHHRGPADHPPELVLQG
jgi:Domain of unknown function (DUF4157)